MKIAFQYTEIHEDENILTVKISEYSVTGRNIKVDGVYFISVNVEVLFKAGCTTSL